MEIFSDKLKKPGRPAGKEIHHQFLHCSLIITLMFVKSVNPSLRFLSEVGHLE